ncbi:MAG: tyrosine--tRNA ligase [Bdellovibrionales bacterium]|nr:tyrosine--tRNA ligase [Bdellovibrionales bacterium]
MSETDSKPTPIVIDAAIKEQARQQFEQIRRGVAEVTPEAELIDKLEKSLAQKKPLRIKLGVDPSTSDLHLGHTVVLQKLKVFQDLGHQVIFLIGDFTAQIGDPTGKSETRKPLSKEDVQRNAKTYYDQVLKILNPSKTQIVFNSQWNDALKIQDVIRLASQMTVARMLERDDFSKRYSSGQSICLHEFLYPIMQAFDSVQLRADVELGGTDQKFNVLLGRDYQKAAGQDTQVAVLLPILEGTDGVAKMSKSLGNAISITEPPKDMFGHIMSISDPLMLRFYELLTDFNLEEIKAMHPRQAKGQLAAHLVERFHGQEAALEAAAEFDEVFAKGKIPTDMPVIVVTGNQLALTKLLAEHGLVTSLSEARRLIAQGGVTVDGTKITDTAYVIEGVPEALVKAGKRKFVKVQFKAK